MNSEIFTLPNKSGAMSGFNSVNQAVASDLVGVLRQTLESSVRLAHQKDLPTDPLSQHIICNLLQTVVQLALFRSPSSQFEKDLSNWDSLSVHGHGMSTGNSGSNQGLHETDADAVEEDGATAGHGPSKQNSIAGHAEHPMPEDLGHYAKQTLHQTTIPGEYDTSRSRSGSSPKGSPGPTAPTSGTSIVSSGGRVIRPSDRIAGGFHYADGHRPDETQAPWPSSSPARGVIKWKPPREETRAKSRSRSTSPEAKAEHLKTHGIKVSSGAGGRPPSAGQVVAPKAANCKPLASEVATSRTNRSATQVSKPVRTPRGKAFNDNQAPETSDDLSVSGVTDNRSQEAGSDLALQSPSPPTGTKAKATFSPRSRDAAIRNTQKCGAAHRVPKNRASSARRCEKNSKQWKEEVREEAQKRTRKVDPVSENGVEEKVDDAIGATGEAINPAEGSSVPQSLLPEGFGSPAVPGSQTSGSIVVEDADISDVVSIDVVMDDISGNVVVGASPSSEKNVEAVAAAGRCTHVPSSASAFAAQEEVTGVDGRHGSSSSADTKEHAFVGQVGNAAAQDNVAADVMTEPRLAWCAGKRFFKSLHDQLGVEPAAQKWILQLRSDGTFAYEYHSGFYDQHSGGLQSKDEYADGIWRLADGPNESVLLEGEMRQLKTDELQRDQNPLSRPQRCAFLKEFTLAELRSWQVTPLEP